LLGLINESYPSLESLSVMLACIEDKEWHPLYVKIWASIGAAQLAKALYEMPLLSVRDRFDRKTPF